MANQIFEIEAVRKRCLDLLRKEDRTMTAGEIAMVLGLPFWAVESGLDSAHVAGLARFTSGAGWHLESSTLKLPGQGEPA